MERTKREKAIKKLENELKEEKQAEKQRRVLFSPPLTSDSFFSVGEDRLLRSARKLRKNVANWRKTRQR